MKRIIFTVLYVFCASVAFASDYPMTFKPGSQADSIEWEYRKNGAITNTGQRTSTIGWDTTFTWFLTNDTLYQIIYYTFYPGQDSAISYMEQFGNGASNGGWFVTARYGYLLDTLVVKRYTGGNLTATDTFLNTFGYTDTIPVSSPNYYTIHLTSVVSGSDPLSYICALQTDTTAGVTPPGSNRCAVTFSVVDNAGDPVKNAWASISMVGGNKVDSSGNVVINTIQTKPTDGNGLVTFNLIWSSYLIPSTRYFIKVGQNIGKYVTVPRESSVLIDFSTL